MTLGLKVQEQHDKYKVLEVRRDAISIYFRHPSGVLVGVVVMLP